MIYFSLVEMYFAEISDENAMKRTAWSYGNRGSGNRAVNQKVAGSITDRAK